MEPDLTHPEHTFVDVNSWTPVRVRLLQVLPELLGRAVTFTRGEATVRIKLPGSSEVSDSGLYFTGDPVDEFARVSAGSRRGENEICEYHIHEIVIFVDPKRRTEVPTEVLGMPPTQREKFSEGQRRELEEIVRTTELLVAQAFDLWIRTLRWKTMNGRICRPAISGPSMQRTYVIDQASGHRFWASGRVLKVVGTRSITEKQWNDTEQSLALGVNPPIWFDLFFDAGEHLELKDLNRTVVDLAMCCEVYMKHQILVGLPKGLSSSVRKHIERARVRERGYRMFEETLPAALIERFRPLRDSLDALFEARNVVVHQGANPNLTDLACERYLSATKELISLG